MARMGTRRYRAAAGLALAIGIGCTQSQPSSGPTSLAGVVSVSTASGLVKASGREVILSRPDTFAVRAAESVCERAAIIKAQLQQRIAGQRSVQETELPLDRQIQVWSEYLTEGVRAAFEFQRERVAAATTDASGAFAFADLPAGYYVATVTMATPTDKYAWTSEIEVKAHVANVMQLDNAVATGSTVCETVKAVGHRLASDQRAR